MEALGQKLKQARLARKISLEEASRITKIRPSRIAEIEQEDFSSFASLAYAKGFLLIYGKFLDVDVTPYLDAFEVSDRVTVDGYSYLQDSGPTAPPPLVRRQPRKSPAFLPFIFAVALLVIGLYLIKLFLNIQRIAPGAREATPESAITASASPSPTAAAIVAPRAQPVEGPPASEAMVTPLGTPIPTATATPVGPTPTEPEIRRALPVHPENLPSTPPPQR
jgi:cytoskeleton protein RodZ